MQKTRSTIKINHNPGLLIIAVLTIMIFLIPANLLYSNIDTEERFGIEFPELAPIRLPEVTEYRLANDMTILLCEDHDFPTISVSVLVYGGSYYGPPDKIGKVTILSELLRNGGTINHSPEELNSLLDDMAISLSTSGRIHTVSLNMNFLSEDAELAFSLLNDVLRNPTFNEDVLQRTKRLVNSAIARRNDEISSITGREFLKLVFGADNPYARTAEYQTVANVTRDDVLEYHQTHFRPQNTYMSIVGDFQKEEMRQLMDRIFGDWIKEETIYPEIGEFPVTYLSSVNLIPREDAQQTWVAIGHITEMTQRHPDYVPMLILNDILGGGLNSRIVQRLRNELGLAYAPQAHYSVYFDFPGVFYLMTQTVADKTMAAIEAMIDEVHILQEDYISEEELELAKEGFLNSFIFNYSTPAAIVRRQINYTLWDYPIDFLEQVRDQVDQVTVEDIHRVANAHIFPEHFIILAVGNAEQFERPLDSLGDVNVVDISIPLPEQDLVRSTPQKEAMGKAIFEQYLDVMGDTDRISNMKMSGVSIEYREDERSRIDVSAYIEFPDKITQLISTPRGDLTMVYNKGATKMTFPGSEMALPPEFAEELRNYLRSNPVSLAQNYGWLYDVYLVEEKEINDKDFYVLSFSDQFNQFLMFIDKETMLPYQTVQDTVRIEGLMTVYRIFERYDEYGGILYPTRIVTKDEHGNILSESDFSYVEFNVELPEDIFTVDLQE